MLKAILSGSCVTQAAVTPLTAATAMAGHRPRTMRLASTGTNDRVTSPTHGSLISRRSVSVARIMNATMLRVKGAGSSQAGGDRGAGRAQADERYVDRDGRAFPHGRLVVVQYLG